MIKYKLNKTVEFFFFFDSDGIKFSKIIEEITHD